MANYAKLRNRPKKIMQNEKKGERSKKEKVNIIFH